MDVVCRQTQSPSGFSLLVFSPVYVAGHITTLRGPGYDPRAGLRAPLVYKKEKFTLLLFARCQHNTCASLAEIWPNEGSMPNIR